MPTLVDRVMYKVMGPLHTRQCPLCGWHGFRFLPVGNEMLPREDAVCPWCQTRERHRAAYVLMKDELGAGGHLTLHVAPEFRIDRWLKEISADYLSIDLYDPNVMRNMDLTALDLPDGSKTLVWCSHVLEHVPDDRKAMAEMYRVLAPGGRAVIQVPIQGDKTYEDPTITSEQDRLKHFLQEDHVRLYGLDIVDRLKGAGFDVEVKRVQDLGPERVRRHGLSFKTTNEVFVCRKR